MRTADEFWSVAAQVVSERGHVIVYSNSAFGIVLPAKWGALPWTGNSQEVLAWLTVCVVLRGDGLC